MYFVYCEIVSRGYKIIIIIIFKKDCQCNINPPGTLDAIWDKLEG